MIHRTNNCDGGGGRGSTFSSLNTYRTYEERAQYLANSIRRMPFSNGVTIQNHVRSNLECVGAQFELGAHEAPNVEHGASRDPDTRAVGLAPLVVGVPSIGVSSRRSREEARHVHARLLSATCRASTERIITV